MNHSEKATCTSTSSVNPPLAENVARLTDEIRRMPEEKQNLFLLLMDSMLMGVAIAEQKKV